MQQCGARPSSCGLRDLYTQLLTERVLSVKLTFLFVCLKWLQLKIYEDDFRRERSDKQVLQRLLLQKAAPNKDPVLIHRCNNEQQLLGAEKTAQSGEKRNEHHPLCPKHPNRDKDSGWASDRAGTSQLKNKQLIEYALSCSQTQPKNQQKQTIKQCWYFTSSQGCKIKHN